ncbi:MAG: hypothetical protein BMS9Abin25_0226 [Gammaproteobacteria bacterium]|nr:MAG: hypothetical protein BMS9Abin25_0226 [Gammaproteobacteria bacterium]
MQLIKTVSTSIILLFLVGCMSDKVLTQDEVENQNKAADVVSSVLFENDLDELASYNIRKDGYVVIMFDDTVSEKKYAEVVRLLRSSADIKGVRAEQFGAEVCGISL